jgi:hypothetical protein
MGEERIFVTGICRQYMTVFLTQNLHFSLMKLGSINAQNNRYWSSIIQRQTFEVPLHDQKIGVWCAITAS